MAFTPHANYLSRNNSGLLFIYLLLSYSIKISKMAMYL